MLLGYKTDNKLNYTENDTIKQISIRGRFAYGLYCLEEIMLILNYENQLISSLVTEMWKISNSEKLGWWQDLLIENNPKTLLADYELFSTGKIAFEECDYTTISTLGELKNRVNVFKGLAYPIAEIIEKLERIANQELFGSCGKYSKYTYEETIKMIEIFETVNNYQRPPIDIVKFSKFEENHGWGNKFTKDRITIANKR